MNIFVFDTETTGLKNPEAIQFAALVLDENLEVVKTYETLLKPNGTIEPGAQAVHGISNGDVENAPMWGDYVNQNPEIPELMMNSLLSGHNIKAFDIPRVMEPLIPGIRGVKTLDTLPLAKAVFKGADGWLSFKLQVIVNKLDLPKRSAHDAMGDVLSCVDFLKWVQSNRHLNLEEMVDLVERSRTKTANKLKSMTRKPE